MLSSRALLQVQSVEEFVYTTDTIISHRLIALLIMYYADWIFIIPKEWFCTKHCNIFLTLPPPFSISLSLFLSLLVLLFMCAQISRLCRICINTPYCYYYCNAICVNAMPSSLAISSSGEREKEREWEESLSPLPQSRFVFYFSQYSHVDRTVDAWQENLLFCN